MATITPGVVTPASAPYSGYSGVFIPTLWSGKLNAKFYATTVFSEIANTDYQGEISGLGDKVEISQIPDIAISNYTIGSGLTYAAPTAPSNVELQIDKAKSFTFKTSDVMNMQSKPNLMDMFSNDATMQMRTVIDSNCIYNTWGSAHASNKGATAGAKSGMYNLGTDTAPVVLTPANILQTLTAFSGVLDEQNIPETDRWLLIDPYTRQLLMQSPAAQAQFMGDPKSMVRTGEIGTIDRFRVFVSNLLPKSAAGTASPWVSGDGSENSITASGTNPKRRLLIAGHKTAITFASQVSKTETIRDPNDFGDLVRGLMVYGYKALKPESLTFAMVS